MRRFIVLPVLVLCCGLFLPLDQAVASKKEPAQAKSLSKEALYKHLSGLARQKAADAALFQQLRDEAGRIDWKAAKSKAFQGNLRLLDVPKGRGWGGGRTFYLVRDLEGEIYILAPPAKKSALDKGSGSPYAGLKDKAGYKMDFKVQLVERVVNGQKFKFLRLAKEPKRLLMDRLFFIAIIILLFLTMVGMGLTLTVGDFAVVFKKPAGMIVGIVCQFGLLPVVAYGLGRLVGFYDTYPFIFLGMILIAASPGGVTSNLMTYLGKGDVALSVALTAVCTVLSLFATPLLLTAYVANIPDFTIPVAAVFKQILVLVIVPLFVGMLIRWKWEGFAKRAEKIFALIGVFALLFLIVVGILGNLEKFGDTDRYGVKFYAMVFVLTFAGMIVSGFIAKLIRIKNFQVRAISLECGLRNASLAMTIAILLQDRIGDFYSSMFFTSGIFGLWMYVAGTATIYLFKVFLPVTEAEIAEVRKP